MVLLMMFTEGAKSIEICSHPWSKKIPVGRGGAPAGSAPRADSSASTISPLSPGQLTLFQCRCSVAASNQNFLDILPSPLSFAYSFRFSH